MNRQRFKSSICLGWDANFDDLFAMNYVKVRFGRLPADSYPKLAFYEKKTFFFFAFDHDDEYYWGAYFVPATKVTVVDDIFKSLYFERTLGAGLCPQYAGELLEGRG